MALTTVRPQGMGFVTGRRNLVINGAMQVYQRGASSSTSQGYVADRFRNEFSGAGVTTSRETLSSGSPYDEGFRSFIRNSNTSVSSATSAYVYHVHLIEAQNIANSGWQYTSASSYLTLQFWVRSSLAGTYYVLMETQDGSPNKTYSFTYTVSADTWTKVTHTFPGDSGITINNDNGSGYRINFVAYLGTNFSTSGHTNEAWQTFSLSDLVGDFAQNWANTASATFDITGVQLEVGTNASDFEHRSFGEELALCQRYFHKTTGSTYAAHGGGAVFDADTSDIHVHLPQAMRTNPSLSFGGNVRVSRGSALTTDVVAVSNANGTGSSNPSVVFLRVDHGSGYNTGDAVYVFNDNDSTGHVSYDAEL